MSSQLTSKRPRRALPTQHAALASLEGDAGQLSEPIRTPARAALTLKRAADLIVILGQLVVLRTLGALAGRGAY
jgi:hypothetical protein